MGQMSASPVQFDRSVIQKELQRILASSAFQGSRRCQDFLSYVVSRALNGESDLIKERIIAVEVFGRDPNSNLEHNSIVRVGAREVRKRLVQYSAVEGTDADIRITLPTGSYLPHFLEAPPKPAADPPAGQSRKRVWVLLAALLLTVLTLSGVG